MEILVNSLNPKAWGKGVTSELSSPISLAAFSNYIMG